MDSIKANISRVGIGANKRTGVVILALIMIPMAVGLLAREQNMRNNGTSSQDVLAANQTNEILDKVGALIELPNEQPSVATVSDASKLRDQQFFKNAQNGDAVIIFPNAQKAILYRPSTDKIIEIAVYTPPSVTPAPAVSVQPSPQSLQDLIGGSSPTPSPAPTINPVISGNLSPSPVITNSP